MTDAVHYSQGLQRNYETLAHFTKRTTLELDKMKTSYLELQTREKELESVSF